MSTGAWWWVCYGGAIVVFVAMNLVMNYMGW